MKCMCSEPCELWLELMEAKDKYHFIYEYCLPATMEGNYERFTEKTLQCCICFITTVKAAAERMEISLTTEQTQDLEQKLIKVIHHYNITIQQHTPTKACCKKIQRRR